MSNILEYKGYSAAVKYSVADNVLHGKIEHISDLITFESNSSDDIKQEFMNAVDDYLEFCKEVGKKPEKPYKGVFNVRVSPELHRKAGIAALKQGVSLNKFVSEAIEMHLTGKNNKTIVVCYSDNASGKWSVSGENVRFYNALEKQCNFREERVMWQA